MSMVTQQGYTSWMEYDQAVNEKGEGFDLDRNYVLQKINEQYQQSITLQQRWQAAANRDLRMLAGDQNYQMQQQNLFSTQSPTQTSMMFNKILLGHNMLAGYQLNNRRSTIIIPEHPQNQRSADEHSEVLDWCMEQDKTYDKISQCFSDQLATGLCLQVVWLDKGDDIDSGTIRSQRLSYSSFIMDPYWEQSDLGDCKWILFRRWMHKSLAADMMPQLRQEIMKMPPTGGQGDNKFNYMPYAYNYAMQDMVAWDEYWELGDRKQDYLYDIYTDQHLKWKLGEDVAQDIVLSKFPERMRLKKMPVQTVRRTILIQNRPVYTQVSPWGLDRYPFVPYVGYHYPQVVDYSLRYQGVVRGAIDAQTTYNRRVTANLAILESQIDSGIKMKEGSLVKTENAFITGPGRILVVARGANMEDVQTIPPPNISDGSMAVAQMMGKEITENMGVTEEMLGIAESNDISGLLAKIRSGAGLTASQKMFANLDRAQTQLGDIFLELIQKNFRGEKVAKILGKVPSAEFYNKDFRKYSSKVVEGVMTNSQKQLEFIQLLQMQELTGRKVPPKLLVETSTLTNKSDLLQAWQQEDQEQQAQSQFMQRIQLDDAEAKIREMEARASNYESSARERDTRSISNIGLAQERSAMASRDRAESQLDNAKTIKELQGMEQTQIIEAISFLHGLEQKQKAEQLQDMRNSQIEAEVAQQRTNANIRKPLEGQQNGQESQNDDGQGGSPGSGAQSQGAIP